MGLAFHMLRNAGVAPPWIEADKEVRAALDERDRLLAQARSREPEGVMGRLGRHRLHQQLDRLVDAHDAAVARLNAGAPSLSLHRRPMDRGRGTGTPGRCPGHGTGRARSSARSRSARTRHERARPDGRGAGLVGLGGRHRGAWPTIRATASRPRSASSRSPTGHLLVAASDDHTGWALNLLADPQCRVTIGDTSGDVPSRSRSTTPVAPPTVTALILRYGTPAERLGAGPAFRLRPHAGGA